METFPDFRWNLEVAWQAENYLNIAAPGADGEVPPRGPGRPDRRPGPVLQHPHRTLLATRRLAGWTYFAHRLNASDKVPYRSAMISDVPTQEASRAHDPGQRRHPLFLQRHQQRLGPSPSRQMQNQCPCWWEGPDGSRVLMMYMPGYAHASGWGLDQSVEQARPRIVGASAATNSGTIIPTTPSSCTAPSATTAR